MISYLYRYILVLSAACSTPSAKCKSCHVFWLELNTDDNWRAVTASAVRYSHVSYLKTRDSNHFPVRFCVILSYYSTDLIENIFIQVTYFSVLGSFTVVYAFSHPQTAQSLLQDPTFLNASQLHL